MQAHTYIVYNNLYNILQYVYADQISEMESHENITKVLVVCVRVCVCVCVCGTCTLETC